MIKIPSYFLGFASKSDGSASLRFGTQELSAEDFAELKRHHNAFGFLIFSENDISEKDIPKEDIEEEGISSSERLRRTLFVYWKQKEIDIPFDTWRKQQMEKYINNVKEKLE